MSSSRRLNAHRYKILFLVVILNFVVLHNLNYEKLEKYASPAFSESSRGKGKHFPLPLAFRNLDVIKRQIRPGKIQKCLINNLFKNDPRCTPEDPFVLEFIRKNHLFKPPVNKERILSQPVNKMDDNVRKALKDKLERKEGGFFIECGANDGEFLSQTLELESSFGWSGLLVEASPSLFAKMKSKNRNAWLTNTCLSSSRPEQIDFVRHKSNWPPWRVGNGRINPDKYYKEPSIVKEGWEKDQYVSEGLVNCFPLHSILKAMGVGTVDFFSLDVEGHEYTILKAIPFHKINIKMIFVEHGMHTKKDKENIRNLLLENGYTLFVETTTDFLFAKN